MPDRPRASAIPAFALYGEGPAGEGAPAPDADLLHIESLQSRSRLHRWEIEPHLHRGLHQIVWLRSGPAAVWLEAERHAGTGPLVVVIPPGVVHGFHFSPDSDGQVLTLAPRAVLEGDGGGPAAEAVSALFDQPRLLPVPPGELPRLGALVENLAAEFGAPGLAGSPVPLWLARALLWRLARLVQQARLDGADGTQAAGTARGQQRSQFTRFVALVEAHHTEHWPIGRYAERLGLTPERLNRLARQHAGRSALQLVHERLLREACRRLAYVAAPVAQTAFDLGFEDPAYFCRFFKRGTGLAPRDWRAARSGG